VTKLLVLAKAPVPGRVKTRLCPPCTPNEAAAIAEAALRDTLSAVVCVPGAEPILVLEGDVPRWLPQPIRVIPQRGDDLAERLSAAFNDAGGECLLIGMDTPQVTAGLLTQAVSTLLEPGVDAVLGHATDGGWWAAGLRRPHTRAFSGVPMSTSHTGAAQLLRFRKLGMTVAQLPVLADVDTMDDALAVADLAPGTHFAATVSDVWARLASRRRQPTAAEVAG
jgi:hypothetical protein